MLRPQGHPRLDQVRHSAINKTASASGPRASSSCRRSTTKSFSEHGDLHRGLHGLQILQRAAEVGLVGEAGDGGGPGSLVGRDHLLRRGSRADFSSGRGFSLELRDDTEGPWAVQSLDQRASGRGIPSGSGRERIAIEGRFQCGGSLRRFHPRWS